MKSLIKIALILTVFIMASCAQNASQKQEIAKSTISQSTIDKVVANIMDESPDVDKARLERGVKQTANLWFPENGTEEEFTEFCKTNFITNSEARKVAYNKIARNFEILYGHFNKVSLELLEPLHLTGYGDITPVDQMFGAYSAGAHLQSDFYKNKIAYIITLNFPEYSLAEKNELGAKWNREEWAYARLGDYFTARVPASLKMKYSETETAADIYIADYNIFAGQLFSEAGEKLFPEGLKLLSHWNIRDEIKSNYADKEHGLDKQRTLYRVMKRIV
ncbi:MAG: hypothetical protein C0599_09895, partial [Salinivirgaceae bacterium]